MKIRTYDSQYLPQGQIQEQQATAGNDGNALMEAGDALQKSADPFVRLAAEKNQVWTSNATSAFQLQQFQALQQAKTDPDFDKKYGPDGGAFASSFQERLDTGINDLVGTAPSPQAAEQLKMQLNGVKDSLMGHAISFQAETGGEYIKTQATEMMQNDAKFVANSPQDASAVLDRGKLAIARMPYLTPEHKAAVLQTYEQNVAKAAGDGQVLHHPEQVLAAIAPDVLSTFKQTPRVQAATAPVTSALPGAPIADDVAQYGPLIQNAAAKNNVDPHILAAQLHVESHGDPNAVNNADIAVTGSPSVGIAQFQPATAAQYGVTDPTDPKQAIPGMAAYMSDLVKQFGGDYRKAAAAYNWGPGNMAQAVAQYGDQWQQHIPASTQNYLDKVFTHAQPVTPAETSVADFQAQASATDPSRAPTNPDWFNKLNWQQQFEIIHAAEQGVRANQVRDSQTLALQKQIHEQQQQQVMNGMFDRIGKPQDQNPLTIAEIRQSDLDYQGKEHMIDAIGKDLRGEARTDPHVFNDLFNRIHAPDGDPTRITDDKGLLPFMGNGVSFEDLNKLRGELRGKNTPDGQTQAELKKNFFNMAQKQIDTSIFSKVIDTQGARQFYNFQQAALTYISKETAAGTDVSELYNPASKKYVGTMIPLYQRTMQQQAADVNRAMSTGTSPSAPQMTRQAGVSINGSAPTGNNANASQRLAAPRQPGESVKDYLKRTGSAL